MGDADHTQGAPGRSNNDRDPDSATDSDQNSLFQATRRSILRISSIVGGVGLPTLSASAQETDRTGDTLTGSTVTPEAFGDDLTNAISTSEFSDAVANSEFSGVTEQAQIYSTELHGLPVEGQEFIVLSSGNATDISGDPTTFSSVDIANGNAELDYSPGGYDAFDIVDLTLEFEVPEGAEGFAFDFKFATEEVPSYLGSQYQDFFEVQLFEPDNTVENIALINGDPVTVDNANEVANTPGGDSNSPTQPLPSSPDTVFNSVTELRTVTRDISNFEGDTLRLVFRVADASDNVFDSAVFIDNLRFTGEVETDPTPLQDALDEYEEAYIELIESYPRAEAHYTARLFNEYGNEYAEALTNYWGYRAGSVPESAVTNDLREILDSSIETINEESGTEITEQRAAIWYDFYNELFSQISESDSLESVEATTTQHYLGEYPNQSNPILLDNGETFSAALSSNFDVADQIYETITQNHSLAQSEVQRTAQGLLRISQRLRSRAQERIKNKEQQAEVVINSNTDQVIEVQTQKLDRPSNAEDVESNIAVTTASLLIIAGSYAAGVVTSHVATKCAGNFALSQREGVEFTLLSVGLSESVIVDQFFNSANYVNLLDDFASLGEPDVETEAVTLFKAGLLSGAKSGAISFGVSAIEILLQWAAALEAEGEIASIDLPDVTERTELGTVGSLVDGLKKFLDGALWSYYNYSPSRPGEATGTVTVKNTGDVIWEPTLSVDLEMFDGDTRIGSGKNVEISGDEGPLVAGEEREFELTYQAPLDGNILSGKATVELGYSPTAGEVSLPINPSLGLLIDALPVGFCQVDYFALEADSQTTNFNVTEDVDTVGVAADTASAGTEKTYSYTPPSDINKAFIDLSFQNRYADLHLYDQQGNHVGYDYETNSVDLEIPNSEYSGRDTGEQNSEWILFQPQSGQEYTIEVEVPEIGTVVQEGPQTESVAPQVTEATSAFTIDATEVPDLPPKLAVTPSTLTAVEGVTRGDTPSISVVLEEVNGEQTAEDVSLTPGALTHAKNNFVINAENISLDNSGFAVSNTATVQTTITIPEGAAEGTYSGEIEVTSSNANTTTAGVNIEVTVTPTEFANNQGIVTTSGLRTAVDEWRQGLIKTTTAREVIDAWRSGESIE